MPSRVVLPSGSVGEDLDGVADGGLVHGVAQEDELAGDLLDVVAERREQVDAAGAELALVAGIEGVDVVAGAAQPGRDLRRRSKVGCADQSRAAEPQAIGEEKLVPWVLV